MVLDEDVVEDNERARHYTGVIDEQLHNEVMVMVMVMVMAYIIVNHRYHC